MKKTIYSVLSLIAVTLGVVACDFNVNNNPNSPSDDSMAPSNILPNSEVMLATFLSSGYEEPTGDFYGTPAATLNMWMGYWARSGQYGSNADQEAYLITSTFAQSAWNHSYDMLYNINEMEKKAEAKEFKAFQGAAKIMKAIVFSMLVDNYDDIIYTEAFKDILAPKYDKGEDVYKALLADLSLADELLKASKPENEQGFQKSDVMFRGNTELWRKLGNTVHLRLALRMVNVWDNAAIKSEISKITANGGGFLDAGESAEVNPNFKNDKKKQNPFWGQYYKGVDGKIKDTFYRGNLYIIDLLDGTGDPRLPYFFREVGDREGGGFVGIPLGEEDQAEKEKHMPGKTNIVAGPGLAKGVNAAIWLLPSFESLFLQAEAIQRGLLPGDPKAALAAAVKESFMWLEVGRYENVLARSGEISDWKSKLNTSVNDYLDRVVKWDDTADKLKLVLFEKYKAMTGVNGFEVFSDYRRTGIPDNLPKTLHSQVGSNHIPYRFIYPTGEASSNKANMPANKNPQTDKVFWAKK